MAYEIRTTYQNEAIARSIETKEFPRLELAILKMLGLWGHLKVYKNGVEIQVDTGKLLDETYQP